MEITNLRFWKSFPYQEGGVEVPTKDHSLPQPDIQYYEGFFPSKNDWLGELQVPDTYLNLFNVNYLAFQAGDADGVSQTFYGWVDSVDIKSDSPNPMTVVTWHPDLWRMWFSQAVLGSGIITRRRPTSTFKEIPPQPYPYRYMKPIGQDDLVIDKGYSTVTEEQKVVWVYFTVAAQGGMSGKYCFPVSVGSTVGMTIGSGSDTAPAWSQLVMGTWDEMFGIDPKSIIGAFYCPYPPNTVSMTIIRTEMNGWYVSKVGSGPCKAFAPVAETSAFKETYQTFNRSICTTDVDKYQLTGWDREVIETLPWGISVRTVAWRVVMGSIACYIQIRGIIDELSPVLSQDRASMYAHQAGVCWSIPMVPVEVTSNAQSAYNYSGARQADMDQILLNADRSRVAGYTQAANSLLGSAVQGMMSNPSNKPGRLLWHGMDPNTLSPITQMSPRGRMVLGKGVTSAVAAASTVALSEFNYHMSTGEWKDRDMAIRDYRAAHQTNGLLMSGSGFDNIVYGDMLAFRCMEIDEYSMRQRSVDMFNYGAYVFEPQEDCEAILPSRGPIQIQNLVVTGPIPSQAAAYIKQRFAEGVILK